MTRKIPELRFAGFSGEWENKSIYKIADVNPKSSELPRIFKYVDLESVKGPFLINYRIENKETAPSRAQRLAKKNDIFFQTVRPYQKNNYLFVKNDEDFVFSTGYAQLRVKENMAQSYVFSYIQTEKFVTNVLNACTGTSYPAISSGDLSKLDIKYPCKKEQEKIGELFETLDACLEDQAAYVKILKKSKKAFLQKLFPQKGAKVPELRFPGFEGDWEEHKISNLFSLTRGNVLSKKKIRETSDDEYKYPVYSSQTLNNGLLGYYNDYLYEDSITWTTDGANAGTVSYREGKFYSTNVNGVLLSSEGYSNKAVAEILNKEAYKYVSRVGNPKLMNNVMADIKIFIPSLAEQEKIGTFFKELDYKIEKEEDKLESFERLKTALLQKVFV